MDAGGRRARPCAWRTDRAATQALSRAVARAVARLAPRWFVVRDAHSHGLGLVQPRWAMSVLRGPMTRGELKQAREAHARVIGAASATPALGPIIAAGVS